MARPGTAGCPMPVRGRRSTQGRARSIAGSALSGLSGENSALQGGWAVSDARDGVTHVERACARAF
eukprot:5424061-Prymnesium_polylepis.1